MHSCTKPYRNTDSLLIFGKVVTALRLLISLWFHRLVTLFVKL